MVSAMLTVVPQIAWTGSGSSDGAAGAERNRAEDMGIDRCVVSECRSSLMSGYALLARGIIHSRKNEAGADVPSTTFSWCRHSGRAPTKTQHS